VGGRGHKAPITENVLAGDLPRLVVYVSRILTQQTGCTDAKSEERAATLAAREWYVPYPGMTYPSGSRRRDAQGPPGSHHLSKSRTQRDEKREGGELCPSRAKEGERRELPNVAASREPMERRAQAPDMSL
jgi:hypothetical protein